MKKYCKPKKIQPQKKQNKKENIFCILIDIVKDFIVFVLQTLKNLIKLVCAITE